MEQERTFGYQPPVEGLLTYRDESIWTLPENWPDYRALGIGPEHIPALIQMATDDILHELSEERIELWAPLHAWRTLGQLRAVEAIEPLLELFDRMEDNDCVREELPVVFGRIGPAALPVFTAYLADASHRDSAQMSVSNSIAEVGKQWPEARAQALAVLEGHLKLFEKNCPEVNAFFISALVDLNATESVLLIKRAFAKKCVDPILLGDWEDVQIMLGLGSTTERILTYAGAREEEHLLPAPPDEKGFAAVPSQADHQQKATQKKARSKMAKLPRKKNRRQ
ncbi:MAG TPA: hypothetical protein VGF67_00470 [Ktedonobacteraceae bacterium]|jgi:hypothetical protein